jgi:hypothetical protein
LFASAAALPFLLDAATFAAAVALVLTLQGNFRARLTETAEVAPPTTMRLEITEGLSWLRQHRLLRTLVFTIGVMNLTFGAAFVVWVLFAQERLALDPVGYGTLAAAIPVGGVFGGLFAARLAGLVGVGTILRASLLVEVVTHIVLASTTSAWTAGAILVLFGFHAIVWGTVSVSLRSPRQQRLPAVRRGERIDRGVVGRSDRRQFRPYGTLLVGRGLRCRVGGGGVAGARQPCGERGARLGKRLLSGPVSLFGLRRTPLLCGCGQRPKSPRSRFVQGHDSWLHGELKRNLKKDGQIHRPDPHGTQAQGHLRQGLRGSPQ